MKERGILYSAPMVRAKLAGTKTQTRRIIKGKGTWSVEKGDITKRLWPGYEDEYGDWQWMKCPYGQPGDRLWGRETWMPFDPDHQIGDIKYAYRADTSPDGEEFRKAYIKAGYPYQWRPSIFMPRAASRIVDEIIEIRVERVQDITEEDAIVEGAQSAGVPASLTNRGAFAKLWDKINGPGSWAANPWVWVIVTKPIQPAPK
jgi:hypothetical protein